MSVAQIVDCASHLKNRKPENHTVSFFVFWLIYWWVLYSVYSRMHRDMRMIRILIILGEFINTFISIQFSDFTLIFGHLTMYYPKIFYRLICLKTAVLVTVQTQIRRSRTRRLIWVYTDCTGVWPTTVQITGSWHVALSEMCEIYPMSKSIPKSAISEIFPTFRQSPALCLKSGQNF